MKLREIPSIARQVSFKILVFAAWIFWSTVPLASAERPLAISEPPTYTRDVARILQQRCQTCHRRDQVGPFSLETYEQARKRASDIVEVVSDRSMPPWKPSPGVGPRFKQDRSLTQGEIAVLHAWAAAGAPHGDVKHMPAPARFSDGWALGTPDLVLETDEDFPVPASGPDVYRCFVIPTNLPKDVYISGIEFKPGNRRVVHHMMAFIDTRGLGRERDAADPGPGYNSYSGAGVEVVGDLGGWAAGNEAVRLPDGVGRFLPGLSDVILQVHYHPSGKPELDRTRIGLYFSRKPVTRTLHWANATNDTFRLSPGQSNVVVKASWYVPVGVEAIAITPHMHQLGRDFRMSVTFPNGRVHDLLYIKDWNPSWQSSYYFEKPITLPKGSIVNVVAHYDNSSHPRNPHKPPKLVTWGPEATDEMCVGYIGVVKTGQDLTRPGEKDDLFEILSRQHHKNQTRRRVARRP